MEELRNPLLGTLNTDDLNQRYSDSYCLYFGEPKYIHGFSWDGDDLCIEHAPINIGQRVCVATRKPFRWDGLNVARPQAGWYFGDFTKNLSPFHMSYPVKKQYKRGLSTRNVTILSPQGRVPFTGLYYYSLLLSPDNYTSITDDLFDTQGSVIPRRDRALLFNGKDGWDFWYRNQAVATIMPKQGLINFTNLGFTQELFEVSRSPMLAAFKRELVEEKKKPIFRDVPKPEEEFVDGDADDLEGAIQAIRRDHDPLWFIEDENSKNWVVERLLSSTEASIFSDEHGGVPPNVRKIAHVSWSGWKGIHGGGQVFLHYSGAKDIERWILDNDKVLLFTGSLRGEVRDYRVGIFHSYAAHQERNKRDDLYVIYQRVD